MRHATLELALKRIDQHIETLDAESRMALSQISVPRRFDKGSHLLQAGQICRSLFWIQKGAIRKYYLSEGKEITTELLFENDIAVSFESYTFQVPAVDCIHAITDVECVEIQHHVLEHHKQRLPQLALLDLLTTEYHALWLELRLHDFHTQDATTRYQSLLAHNPMALRRVPLKYIASYLGVSIETLSRIRARV